MKEYVVNLSTSFHTGLRPFEDELSGGRFLLSCQNAIPSRGGMKYAEKLVRSFISAVDGQIIETSVGDYFLTSDTIYEVVAGNPISRITGLSVGDRWSVGDFGRYLVFTNGVVTVEKNPYTGVFSVYSGSVIPQAATLCALRGSLILGNIQDASFGSSSKVVWSDTGAARFATTDDLRTAREGTAGNRVDTDIGDVVSILPIYNKNACIVYGTKKIIMLYAKLLDTGGRTFGRHDVLDIGISTQGAAVATDSGHFVVTDDGDLYVIDNDGNEKGLGYSEFITTPDSVVLSYDSTKKDTKLYIALSSITYVLTHKGMGSITASVRSLVNTRSQGKLIHATAIIVQDDLITESDDIDLRRPGFKTMEGVTVSGKFPDSMYVSVGSRARKKDSFVYSDWKLVNDEGWVYIGISAIEFRVRVKAVRYTTPLIKGMDVGVKFMDRRFIRGTGASNDNKDLSETDG